MLIFYISNIYQISQKLGRNTNRLTAFKFQIKYLGYEEQHVSYSHLSIFETI